MTNTWCEILKIEPPVLEKVKDHAQANSYTLMMVALLEKGGPMLLDEVAVRFEEAGIAPRESALRSLQRCRPARPPIYRTGDNYSLDPHDNGADLWMFRLDLRPPKVPHFKVVQPEPKVPDDHEPLSVSELDEAWKDTSLNNWSARRLALAIIEAHQQPMFIEEIISFLEARTNWFHLSPDLSKFRGRSSPVKVLPDDSLTLAAVVDMIPIRKKVRELVKAARAAAASRPNPAVINALEKKREREEEARLVASAKMRRAILYAFPEKTPEALVLLDVERHQLTTFFKDDLSSVTGYLSEFDIIAGIHIRSLLETIGFNSEKIVLAELGATQKTKTLNKRGKKLKITPELLIQGTCGISRPLGDKAKLTAYLRDGATTKLQKRLEANAKSLYAFYEYGRLHGVVRLRWGFIDEMLVAPWARQIGSELYSMARIAERKKQPLDVILGNAPGWDHTGTRNQLAFVILQGWRIIFIDEDGFEINPYEIQRARIVEPGK